MADDVIGSVKVRIRPDTSRFAKETEDGVDKAVDRVNRKAKTSKDLQVQLHSTLDTRDIKSDALKGLREINAELKTNDRYKVQFRAAISKTGMKRTVAEARRHLQLLADAQKAVDFKATLSETELKQVRESIKQLGQEIEDDLSPSLKLRFNEDSLNEVRGAMERVKAALADLDRVDVKVNLDEESLLAELDRLKEMERELPMTLTVDKSSVGSLKAAIAAIDAELSRQAQIEIDVSLDKASLLAQRAEFAAIVAQMEAEAALAQKRAQDAAKAAEKAAKEAADRAKKRADDAVKDFHRMTSAAGTGLAAVTGLRLTGGIFKHFRDFFSTLDEKIPHLSVLSLALAGIGGVAIKSAASLFTLARSLAQIGPGAVALPGIFGGIAIGLGATVAVFRDFNKVLPDVKDRLSAIQDSMSEKFWAQAKGPISDMIDNLLPKFADGLDITATRLGNFFGALADGFSKSLGGNVLAGMFADLNKSITIFTGSAGSIAEIVRILGTAGAGRLPQLAEWVGKLTDQFAGFLANAEKTGKIDQWIDTAIVRIKSLGEVIKNASSFLTGIAEAADAATPGDALQNLADGLGRLAAITNDAGWQAKLTGVLVAVDQMMNNISSRSGAAFLKFWDNFSSTLTVILPKAGEAIGTVFDGIYSMIGSAPVQSGLIALFDGIAKGAEAMRPAFDALAPKMGATLELVGALAEAFGQVMSSVIQATAPVAAAIMETLTPVIEKIGPMMSGIFKDLAPVFAAVAEHIGKMKGPLLSLVDSFQRLWNIVGPVLVPVLTTLVTIISGALRGVFSGIALAISGVTQVITGVINVFKGFGNIFMGVIEALTGGGLGRLKTGFSQVFGGLKDIVVGALKAVAGALWAWLNGSLIGAVRGGLVKMLGIWKGGWKGILNAAKAVWNGIKGGATTFMGAVKGLITRGVNGVKTAWSQAWNAIKAILGPIWGAIKGVVSGAISAVKGTITTTVNVIKGIWKGDWAAVRNTLSNAWDAMKTKVVTKAQEIFKKAKAMPGEILSALGNLGTKLKASGVALIQGFLDGISEKFRDVKSKVSGWMSDLRGLFPFSPAKWGPFSGKGYTTYSGRALMEDFGNGIMDGTAYTMKAATDAIDKVKEAQEKADSKAAKAARKRWKNLGGDLVAATKQGLLQNLPGIKSLVNTITKDIPDGVSKKIEKKLRSQAASMANKVDALSDVMSQIDSKVQEIKDAAEDFAATAVQAMTDLGNPASLGALEMETPEISFDQIKANYDAAIERAREFSRVITELAGMKLNDATLQQLIEAGPEAGYAAAQAIADAGQGGVDEINALAGNLATAAGKISETAYNSMYETGRQAAEGILQGLRSERDRLMQEIEDLAKQMAATMRRALRIKSPSRVFREIGGYTGQGFVLGIQDYHDKAEKAITELGSGRPKAPAVSGAVAGAVAASTTNNRTINYYAAAGSSQISGEESLFAALNRARSNGF